jgi:hypothetical protein
MSGPTTILNSWKGVANRRLSDESSSVHAGYLQGANPLLARSLVSMMAMSPHFQERLSQRDSAVARLG